MKTSLATLSLAVALSSTASTAQNLCLTEFVNPILGGALDLTNSCGLFCDSTEVGSNTIPTDVGGLDFSNPSDDCDPGQTFAFVVRNATGPNGNLVSGTIPTGFSQIDFDFGLFLSNNALTGTLPNAVKGNSNIKVIDIENNAITSTSAAQVIGGLHDGIQQFSARDNLLSGNYDDSALITYLETAPALTIFSISLDGTGCLTINNINDARFFAGLGDIQFGIPGSGTCAPTPAPVGTFPPFSNEPSVSPTDRPTSPTVPGSTRNPTPSPSPSPNNGPPTPATGRPTAPTPRTLPPNPASTTAASIFVAAVAVVLLAC